MDFNNFASNYLFKTLEQQAGNIAGDTIEAVLHTNYPDNFEYYLMALEVRDEAAVNVEQRIKRSLIFPTNPERIIMIQRKLSKMTKTFRGVIVNELDTFVPMPINLSGTFGRKLRILYGSKVGEDLTSTFGSKLANVSTGFGTIKLLEEIFALSKETNENGVPYRVVFYNLPFSSAYIVKLDEIRFSQSIDKNRLWMYDLQMTAVSPLGDEGYNSEDERVQQLLQDKIIGNAVNRTIDGMNTFINSIVIGQGAGSIIK